MSHRWVPNKVDMALIFALSFSLASASDVIDCIRMDCAGHTLGTCGKYNQTLSSVEIELCSNGKGCYGSEVQRQYLLRSGYYPCLTVVDDYDYTITDQSKRDKAYTVCSEKLSSYSTLKEGSHPKICFNDE